MSNRKGLWQRMAKVVSVALHPWLVFAAVVALVAYDATDTRGEWGRWTLATLFLAYTVPILYLRLRAGMLGRGSSSRISIRSIFRERPQELLLLACLFGVPSSLALYYLGGPDTVLAVLIAATGTMVLASLLNFVYRASFHLALVTGMLSSLWVLFGAVSLVTVPIIAILGLARYRLGEHTSDQLVAGFVLGLMVTLTVFRGLGLWFGGGSG